MIETIVNSPISGKPATRLVTINKSIIIDKYTDELSVSIDEYFLKMEVVSIYKCLETGYRFYYPFNISGDENFYSKLQNSTGYYPAWKHENEMVLKYLKTNDLILDVGCGEGNFLKELSKRHFTNLYGIDLSSKKLKYDEITNIIISNESIVTYGINNAGKFDIVTCFQVLEHTADVYSFINGCLKCLKPGGKLIIAVPNNNPYLYKHGIYETLNLPPHHMGLWDKKSIEKLCNYFNMDLLELEIEPLGLDIGKYTNIQIDYLKSKFLLFKFCLKSKLIRKIFCKYIYTQRNRIEGRNLIAVFQRDEDNKRQVSYE